MPHVTLKLWPGTTEEQRQQLAEALAATVVERLGCRPASLSVAVVEVSPERWREEVVEPDLLGVGEGLLVKPGYPI